MYGLCHWFCVFVGNVLCIFACFMHFFCVSYAFYLWTGLVLLVGSFKYLWYMRLCEPDIHVIFLFEHVIYLGYLSWAKVYIFMQLFDIPMILEKNWDELSLIHMCNDLIVQSLFSKTFGFKYFLIKFDEPIIKLHVFLYAFLMHFVCLFLCISYSLLMHFFCVLYRCIRRA